MTFLLMACALLVAPCVLAQNTDNPFRPYDGDTSTAILYHFDEDGGGIEPNEGPAALFGTVTGGRWVPTGRFGGALAMDGATQIDPARSLLFASDDLTMEAWVYPTERSGAVFLIDSTWNDDKGTWGRLLAIDVNGRPFAFAVRAFDTPRVAVAPGPIPLNQWTHIAGLWWESGGKVQIAVNGVVVATDFLAEDEDGDDRITIGRSQSIPDPRGFVGWIDEVRVSAVRRELRPVAVESRSWGAIKSLY